MNIPAQQIGWSQQAKLLSSISSQLEYLTKIIGKNITTTTTTTTTATPVPGNVQIDPSVDFDIVGDFTIEFWVNMSNLDGFPRVYSFGVYPAANALSIEGGQAYFWGNNSNLVNGSFSPNIGEWNHIAIMAKNATVYMMINGFPVASSPYTGDISSQGLPLTIGYGNEDNSYLNGKLSNFRWSTIAIYDENGFTPPTSPLSALPSTVLLIFQGTSLETELTDVSGNNHNATNTGAAYSADNPFSGEQGSLQMGVA